MNPRFLALCVAFLAAGCKLMNASEVQDGGLTKPEPETPPVVPVASPEIPPQNPEQPPPQVPNQNPGQIPSEFPPVCQGPEQKPQGPGQKPGGGGTCVPTQPAPSACANPVNQTVNFDTTPARMMMNNFGYMAISLLEPWSLGGSAASTPRVGTPQAVFPFPNRNDNSSLGTLGPIHQGIAIRGGRTIIGLLTLQQSQQGLLAVMKLNGNEIVPIGRVEDTAPGSNQYPRKAKVIFDFGACLAQYLTSAGTAYGDGSGYIILP